MANAATSCNALTNRCTSPYEVRGQGGDLRTHRLGPKLISPSPCPRGNITYLYGAKNTRKRRPSFGRRGCMARVLRSVFPQPTTLPSAQVSLGLAQGPSIVDHWSVTRGGIGRAVTQWAERAWPKLWPERLALCTVTDLCCAPARNVCSPRAKQAGVVLVHTRKPA